MTNTKIFEGNGIYIRVSYATAHCALGVYGVSGTIIQVREKAVQVAAYTPAGRRVTAWFPRKALVDSKIEAASDAHVHLAKWFKPREWTARFIELCADSAVVSA